jgi:hypothetical protein
MDAFNPATIAAEWRRESSVRERVKHHSNDILRKFHFKGDGIPKVIICEFETDDAQQCNSERSLASDSTSGAPRLSKSPAGDDLTESVPISSQESPRVCPNSASTTAFTSMRSISFSDVSNHRSGEEVPIQIHENKQETPGLANNIWNDPLCSTQTEQEWGMSSRSSRTHESAPGLLESSSISMKGTKHLNNNLVHCLQSEFPADESPKVSERPKRNNCITKPKYVDLTNNSMTAKSRNCKGLDNPRLIDWRSSTNVLNVAITEDETVRKNSKYMDKLFAVPGKPSRLLMASPGMYLSKSQPYPHSQAAGKKTPKRCHGVSYLDTLFGSEGPNGQL